MDGIDDYLAPVSNVAYVAVMLYGFVHMPANFMLVTGLLTLVIGPFVLGWLLQLTALAFTTAAYAPFVVILIAWVVVFLKSALFQRLALTLGLDRDGDGDVDSMDMLYALSDTRAGKFLRLHEVWDTLTRMPSVVKYEHSQLQKPLIERLDRIEVAVSPRGSVPPRPAASKGAKTGSDEAKKKAAGGNGGGSPCGHFLGLPSLPAMPRWASPSGSEAFAAKQRERAHQGGRGQDLV